MPYYHPNHNKQYINQQTNVKQNQYEKISEDKTISRKRLGVELYYFLDQRGCHHKVL